MEDKIRAMLVIELLGRPKEHVTEALQTHVTKLGSEKGIKILNKTYHEPVLAQDSQTLYSTFAEIEAEFDTPEVYLGIILAYLPAHAEIIKPESIPLRNHHLTEIGNALLQRVHNYDAIVKNALAERDNLLFFIKGNSPDLYDKLTKNLTPEQKANLPTEKTEEAKSKSAETKKAKKSTKKKSKKKK